MGMKGGLSRDIDGTEIKDLIIRRIITPGQLLLACHHDVIATGIQLNGSSRVISCPDLPAPVVLTGIVLPIRVQVGVSTSGAERSSPPWSEDVSHKLLSLGIKDADGAVGVWEP